MGIGWSLLLVDGFRGASGAGADVGPGFWGDTAAWASRLGGLSIRLLFAACSGRRFFDVVGAGAELAVFCASMHMGFSNRESWKTCMPSFGMK